MGVQIDPFVGTQIVKRTPWRGSAEHVIVLVVDADEAENIAMSLGPGDAGARELMDAATEVRELDREVPC